MKDKEFIPYEQALALKELGFDEPCFGRYWHEDFKIINIDKQFEKPDYVCLAPLYQQAVRWFRENHELRISNYRAIIKDGKGIKIGDGFRIFKYGKDTIDVVEKNTYEEMIINRNIC